MQIPAAAAFDFRQGKVMAHRVEVRMDFQCAAKTDRRFAKLLQRHMAKTLTR